MLIIDATDMSTNDDLIVVHNVEKQGKVTEEHHFYVYTKGEGINGKPLFAFATGSEQAKELRSHL
jgi:hypothetical protein